MEGPGFRFHKHSFSSPLGFTVRLSSVSPLLSHVFCYVDVVTREHPRVGKHSDPGQITSDLSSVLGNSLASHSGLLFTVDSVSDLTISTFSFTTFRGMSLLFLCRCVCVRSVNVCGSWNISDSFTLSSPTCLPDWGLCDCQLGHSLAGVVKSNVTRSNCLYIYISTT